MSESAPQKFKNPFRPGAGHMPPYLAGRQEETEEFERLLGQEVILENLVLTGLRGLGKTVLLETFKPTAIRAGWLWVGTDMSESISITEDNLATRLITDLSVVTSAISFTSEEPQAFPLARAKRRVQRLLNFETLFHIYAGTPGLVADKLKHVFETVWGLLSQPQLGKRGIIFAYDEAQNLADHAAKDQYPLSLLLDVFQSIQRKNIPFMLALTGLPTLFPKLVEARTYAERMFRVVFLNQLDRKSSREAILRPIEKAAGGAKCPVKFSEESIGTIYDITRGYPYFIQYICREVFDVWLQKIESGQRASSIPANEILRKLDSDFFAGRWARATDRQRDLLAVVSLLDNCDSEWTVQEVVEQSKHAATAKLPSKPFSSSHVNQMLVTLGEAGLVYKNRHGKYSFAVPLLGEFIRRQKRQQMEQMRQRAEPTLPFE